MLSAQRDHDGGVFRALAFVDRRGVSENELIKFAKAKRDFPAIELSDELAFLDVDARYDAEIAVIDVFVVVVLDLHDLVARAEGPAEAFDADLARRVQRRLQLDVEGTGTEAAAVHRA